MERWVEAGEKSWNDIRVATVVVESANRRRCALICLPHSVVWISADALQALGLENDPLSGPKTLYCDDSRRVIPVLQPVDPIVIAGSSVNIDNRLALVSAGEGFNYTHAADFNRKSAAIDKIVPLANWGAWQMAPGVKTDETWRLAHAFGAKFDGNIATVTVQDGPTGHRYRIRAVLAPTASQMTESSVSVDRID
jgi:hypothetical protein